MVRNDGSYRVGYKPDNMRERTPLDHATYDIVDNECGTERVIAQGVRIKDAELIVFALNH